MQALLQLVTAFLLTLAVECGLALFWKSKQLLYAVFLCNLLTNPLLNLLLMLWVTFTGPRFYWVVVAVLEIGVVAVETAVLRGMLGYDRRKALGLSALFNVYSFGAGLIVSALSPFF